MTVTPPPSTPGAWPLDDEVFAIDQQIADLQRAADQAQASGAVAASEVAIAQKAIRDLSTAKAEIQEKGKLWDRTSQLLRALAERKGVADRVRQALADGGSLAAQRKTDLETALKTKAGLDPAGDLEVVFDVVNEDDATRLVGDNDASTEWLDAAAGLETAKRNYASKAAEAEAAWAAIQNGARNLEAQLSRAQQRLAEAAALSAAVESPATPVLNPAAAEAGVAWKDFVDDFDVLTEGAKVSVAGSPDDGETALVTAWENARDAVRDALAVVLDAQRTAAEKQRAHQERQAPRPYRSASEREAVMEKVREALTPTPPAPPSPPGP